MALNPKVPALREAMEQVLTPEEQPQYEAHMPPGRSWRGSRRMASTYLRASKDSFSQTRSAKAVPRDNHTRRLQSTPFSRSYVVHSHAAKRLSARHCGHVLGLIAWLQLGWVAGLAVGLTATTVGGLIGAIGDAVAMGSAWPPASCPGAPGRKITRQARGSRSNRFHSPSSVIGSPPCCSTSS